MENEFSVCQFFQDDSYEYVRRFVPAKEAIEAFNHYTTSVGARIGTTKRVIITDGGDCGEYGMGVWKRTDFSAQIRKSWIKGD